MQRTLKIIIVMEAKTVKEEAKRIPYGMMNRRTKQEQNQACLSYALQGGGRPQVKLTICTEKKPKDDKTSNLHN